MTKRFSAPTAHVWRKVGKSLWYCAWCDAYTKSATKPSPEAKASRDARKQAEMLGLIKEQS